MISVWCVYLLGVPTALVFCLYCYQEYRLVTDMEYRAEYEGIKARNQLHAEMLRQRQLREAQAEREWQELQARGGDDASRSAFYAFYRQLMTHASVCDEAVASTRAAVTARMNAPPKRRVPLPVNLRRQGTKCESQKRAIRALLVPDTMPRRAFLLLEQAKESAALASAEKALYLEDLAIYGETGSALAGGPALSRFNLVMEHNRKSAWFLGAARVYLGVNADPRRTGIGPKS